MAKTFIDLNDHMKESGVLDMDNHVLLLIKSLSRNFLKIRMHHVAKEFNQSMIKNNRVRKKFNKLVLFKNQ